MSVAHGIPNQIKFVIGFIVLSFIFTLIPVNLYRDLPYINTVAFNNEKNKTSYYKVTRVIDGDTLEIDFDIGDTKGSLASDTSITGIHKIRLIGINTPETVDPRRPVQCYGQEASAHMKSLIEGDYVQLEYDNTQDQYDKYGRVLAYIYTQDGQMINKKMIADGYAYEYTYNTPYKYRTDFKAAQTIAQREGRGLWSADSCNGKL